MLKLNLRYKWKRSLAIITWYTCTIPGSVCNYITLHYYITDTAISLRLLVLWRIENQSNHFAASLCCSFVPLRHQHNHLPILIYNLHSCGHSRDTDTACLFQLCTNECIQ